MCTSPEAEAMFVCLFSFFFVVVVFFSFDFATFLFHLLHQMPIMHFLPSTLGLEYLLPQKYPHLVTKVVPSIWCHSNRNAINPLTTETMTTICTSRLPL